MEQLGNSANETSAAWRLRACQRPWWLPVAVVRDPDRCNTQGIRWALAPRYMHSSCGDCARTVNRSIKAEPRGKQSDQVSSCTHSWPSGQEEPQEKPQESKTAGQAGSKHGKRKPLGRAGSLSLTAQQRDAHQQHAVFLSQSVPADYSPTQPPYRTESIIAPYGHVCLNGRDALMLAACRPSRKITDESPMLRAEARWQP